MGSRVREIGEVDERPELSVCLTVHPKCGRNFGALLVIKKSETFQLRNMEILRGDDGEAANEIESAFFLPISTEELARSKERHKARSEILS